MSLSYESRLTTQMLCVCSNTTAYTFVPVSMTEKYKLPPEHRVKPVPLDVTSRAQQYDGFMTSAVSRFDKTEGALYCGGKWYPQKWTYWTYAAPTSFVSPAMAYTSLWAGAIRLKIQADKVSFAESIGEWRECVGLVESAVKTLQRAKRAAVGLLKSRRRIRTAGRWFKAQFGKGPNSRLELLDAVQLDLAIKFGIKPTANLIYDSIQELKVVRKRDRRLQVTTPEVAYKYIKGTYGGAYAAKGVRTSRCIVKVRYKEDSSNFTAGNLAESLWAGTNLSFVLDWFVDVSGYLRSFNGMLGVTLVSATVSHREKVKAEDTRLPGPAFNGSQGYTLVTPGKGEFRAFKRDKLTTLPFADLPAFHLPDSELWERLATLTEILVMQRRK